VSKGSDEDLDDLDDQEEEGDGDYGEIKPQAPEMDEELDAHYGAAIRAQLENEGVSISTA
jgi:hypothetical protein